MGVEGWILALIVVGVPGSIALFVWTALQTQSHHMYIHPVWIVLLEGSQDDNGGREDEGRDDWGGGGQWPPPKPHAPGDASGSPDGRCRRGPAVKRGVRRARPESPLGVNENERGANQ